MIRALNGISRFIQSQMDVSTARQMAMQNIQNQDENSEQITDINQVTLNSSTVEHQSESTDSGKVIISVK